MNRLLAAARLHTMNPSLTVGIPQGDRHPQLPHQPRPLGHHRRRRGEPGASPATSSRCTSSFYLATALAALALSLLYGIALSALVPVEDATGGGGVRLNFFAPASSTSTTPPCRCSSPAHPCWPRPSWVSRSAWPRSAGGGARPVGRRHRRHGRRRRPSGRHLVARVVGPHRHPARRPVDGDAGRPDPRGTRPGRGRGLLRRSPAGGPVDPVTPRIGPGSATDGTGADVRGRLVRSSQKCRKGPHRVVGALAGNGCPAVSYSPTPSPGQYHRR